MPRRQTSAMSAIFSVEALVGRQLVRVAVAQDVEPLSHGLHHAVFDAVVDHLHEVPGAGRAGMDVALLGARIVALAAVGALDRADARGEGRENRVEVVVPPPSSPPIIRQ